jgi:hypothetical protein
LIRSAISPTPENINRTETLNIFLSTAQLIVNTEKMEKDGDAREILTF